MNKKVISFKFKWIKRLKIYCKNKVKNININVNKLKCNKVYCIL